MLKKLIALFILATFPFTSFVNSTARAQQNVYAEFDNLMSHHYIQELISRYENTLHYLKNQNVEDLDLAKLFAYQYLQVFPSTVKGNVYTVTHKKLHNDLSYFCKQMHEDNPKHKHARNCRIILVVAGIFNFDENLFATLVAYTDYLTLDSQTRNNTYYLKQHLLIEVFGPNRLNSFYNRKPSSMNFTVKKYSIDQKYFSAIKDVLKIEWGITLTR
ncbi:hypothetical protein CKF59_00265 [Psittacicella gerlachiana]|uniref:DUF4919 domain-containing protein n=2 Tax=Psittacicella gerlachiana TaxID=2028574 RepID=A0A3A1YNJ1_9GAMM|nr:hypothetical protein CKF59_00265 [Psittacicella gerlachiana]